MYIPQYNYKKIGIGGVVLFIFGILFTYVIFPPILRKILISQVWLKPGSQMREMYDELPFPLIFKVFVFNVTNKDEVTAGGKPALQEIGPFVFEEYKIRIDQIDDKDEDTLEYNLINTFIFNERLSNGLTGNEIITMPHPLLTLMALNTNRERHALLPLVSTAIKHIFHNPTDAFWSGKVIDIIFHGIDIDCSSDEYSSKAACNVFESGDVKSIRKPLNYPPQHYLFSLFGSGNGTDAGRYKVYRGIKNISDLGRIISVDDESETDAWSGDECNQIHGTDATIFPPFMSKETGLWAFEPAICRSMKAVYEKPSKYSGLPTLRYTLDLGDIRADEQLHCFCDDENDIETCPLRGTMDIFKCADAALVVSLPHFYKADESLLKNIKSGLNPVKEHHEMFIDFEIISGTAVSGAKRVQVNLDMKPVDKVESMKTLPEMVFPLLWIEEGVNLNKTYVNMLKYQLFLALKFQSTMKYLCLIGGSLGGVISAILHYKRTQQITVMKPLENQNTNSDEVLNEIEINNIKNINLSKNPNIGINANSTNNNNDNNNNNNNNDNNQENNNLNNSKQLHKHQIIQKY